MRQLMILATYITVSFFQAGSASASVTLCNSTPYPFSIYEAYQKEKQYENGTMSSRTWLAIPANSCKKIISNPRGFLISYYIASINKNGERILLKDVEFELNSDSEDISVQADNIELIDLEQNFCVRHNSRDALRNAPTDKNLGVEKCPSGSYSSEIDFTIMHPQGTMAANLHFDGQKMWIERF
jgi:uncharacterized membrane protein